MRLSIPGRHEGHRIGMNYNQFPDSLSASPMCILFLSIEKAIYNYDKHTATPTCSIYGISSSR
jgi:hypothetical protein